MGTNFQRTVISSQLTFLAVMIPFPLGKLTRSMSPKPASVSQSRCSCSVYAWPPSYMFTNNRLNPTVSGGERRESSKILPIMKISAPGSRTRPTLVRARRASSGESIWINKLITATS